MSYNINKALASKNLAAIEALRKNKTRLYRNETFIEISLSVPSKDATSGLSYKERLTDSRIVTDSGLLELDSLSDSTEISFEVKLIKPNVSPEFSHNVLKAANESTFKAESLHTIYIGKLEHDTDNVWVEFLGQEFSYKDVIAWAKIHLTKLGKTQDWKTRKGEYIINE